MASLRSASALALLFAGALGANAQSAGRSTALGRAAQRSTAVSTNTGRNESAALLPAVAASTVGGCVTSYDQLQSALNAYHAGEEEVVVHVCLGSIILIPSGQTLVINPAVGQITTRPVETRKKKWIFCAGHEHDDDWMPSWDSLGMNNAPSNDPHTFLDEPCIFRRNGGKGRLLTISNIPSGPASPASVPIEFSVALVGITFEGGNAEFEPNVSPGSGGPFNPANYGGAFITPVCSVAPVPAPGAPRLHVKAEYCHFLNNKAYYRGGVGYIGCTTDVIADHCEFTSNAQSGSPLESPQQAGGGVFYLDDMVADNMATLLATASSFQFNSATGYGGVLYQGTESIAKLHACELIGNKDSCPVAGMPGVGSSFYMVKSTDPNHQTELKISAQGVFPVHNSPPCEELSLEVHAKISSDVCGLTPTFEFTNSGSSVGLLYSCSKDLELP